MSFFEIVGNASRNKWEWEFFYLKIFGNGLLIRTQKYEEDQLRMEIGHYLDDSNSINFFSFNFIKFDRC